MNPLGCAAALHQVARNANVDLKIAVVTGDDLMGEVFQYFVKWWLFKTSNFTRFGTIKKTVLIAIWLNPDQNHDIFI